MGLININSKLKILLGFASDESLTKKASLNAIASALDYIVKLVVAFTITPLTVTLMGDYLYGIWKILTSSITFISPASGRPSTVLRWTLAHHLSSTDYNQKRVYIGSALAVWLLFLPLVCILGGVFSWFIPITMNSPQEFIWIIRITAAVLVVNLAVTGLGAIPQAVMGGQNMGYKRMGLTAFMVIISGGLTWLALILGYGLIGVGIATTVSTILSGILYLSIAKKYAPWFGFARPDRNDIRSYMNLSWWFISWDVIYKLMIGSDVLILGLLHSVESVTSYTLTKYAPEMIISIVAMIVFGVAPGLGGIIGSRDFEKANKVRGEILALTWIIITSFSCTIMLWNRIFLSLWVGSDKYTGPFSLLLILVMVIQFILIRIDGNFIDLTLQIKQKVFLGALSIAITFIISVILVGTYKLGVVGILIGMIIGRLPLSIGYPIIIGRVIKVPISTQVKKIIRPLIITVSLILIATITDSISWNYSLKGFKGWILFFLFAGLTALVFLAISFFTGLSRKERMQLWKRVNMVISLRQ